MADHAFDALGTRWTVRTAEPLEGQLASALHARAEDFDATYSRFRPDSPIRVFAAEGGRCALPPESTPMLELYRSLYDATDGALTPLVGRILEHLGYDPDYSLTRRPGVEPIPAWDDVLTVDGAVLTSTRPVLLDLGCAGKGFLVDLLAALLDDAGVSEYLIDGSGDLRHRGPGTVRVGLECPDDPTKAIGVANLAGRALCASAVTRRRWGDGLHHIVDPATGEPTTGVLATWVLAETAMIADGLATALFLSEPEVLARSFTFSYVRMLAGGAVQYSMDFDGELFR